MKNTAAVPEEFTLSVERFDTGHKWQAHGEREFFDYYDHHNEVEWGSEHRTKCFKELKAVNVMLEPQFCGYVEVPIGIALEKKDDANDDDRLAVVLRTESSSIEIAKTEEFHSYIRCINGIAVESEVALADSVCPLYRDGSEKYNVLPDTPCVILCPALECGEAEQVINGYNRRFSENPYNMWRPKELPAYLELSWEEIIKAHELRITFDTLERTAHEMPYECGKRAAGQCVKRFKVELMKQDQPVLAWEEDMHHNRLYVKTFPEVEMDCVRLTLLETWEEGRLPGVYEIRVY